MEGIGTTRETCAVPSASNVAESAWVAEFDCGHAGKMSAAPTREAQQSIREFHADICSRVRREGERPITGHRT